MSISKITSEQEYRFVHTLPAATSIAWEDKNQSMSSKIHPMADPMAATSETQVQVPKHAATNANDVVSAGKLAMLYLLSGLVVSGPTVAFVASYTAIGYGEPVYRELNNHYATAESLAYASGLLLVIAYVLDTFTGTSLRPVKTFIITVCLIGLAVGAILAVDWYPSSPAVIYVLILLGLVYALRKYAYPEIRNATFLYAQGAAMFLNGAVLMGVWNYWVEAGGWSWGTATREHFMGTMECDVSAHSQGDEEYCLAAFLVWAWPAAIASLCLILAVVAVYLASSATQAGKEKRKHAALRPLVLLICALALGIYITSSIAGVQMGLAEVVMQFIMLTFVVLVLLMIAAFGRRDLSDSVQDNILIKRLHSWKNKNWLRGLLLLLCLPVLAIMCVLSAVNMAVRRYARLPCSVPVEKEEEKKQPPPSEDTQTWPSDYWLWFLTPKMGQFLHYLLHNPSMVLLWAHWMGVVYFSMDVGVGRLVYLFLSWLNETTASMSPAVVTIIILCLGIFLFLLPPVPGVPIYLFAGIVMVNSLRGDLGFELAIFVVTLVCLCIKLCACTIQQKVFGESLGKKVAVRKVVGINSIQMRAIRHCLSQPGLSPAKVAILCGGPDWPTSVLCGILGLPLRECLLGTLPVYPVYLSETVVAGALILKESEGEEWAAAAATMLAVCAAAMGCTTFAAVYFIEDTIHRKKEELMQYPTDEEVAAADRAEEEGQSAYANETVWEKAPTYVRVALLAGTVAMSAASFLFYLFPESCFVPFVISDSIGTKLSGNALNIVRPIGWGALGLFAFGCITLHTFNSWAKRVTDEAVAKAHQEESSSKGEAVAETTVHELTVSIP